MKRPNYTQRTLAELKKQGAIAGVCEKWVMIPGHPGGGVRRDLFGLFDIVAIRGGKIVGIQTTSRAGKSAHVETMFSNEALAPWLEAGALAELWLWQKKPMGGIGTAKRSTYTLDIQAIKLA
jgi:hypothetical protein